MVELNIWLWAGVLIIGVLFAHWGSEKVTNPLKKLRRQWGLSAVAGGAFIGIAAASPEVTINAVSAYRNVSDIGLGVILGTGIIGIPLTTTVAYLASRKRGLGSGDGRTSSSGNSQSGQGNSSSSGGSQSAQGSSEHGRHRQTQLLRVSRDATWVLALPYLGILAVVAILTLPAQWRGLQPIDSWILLAAYFAFLGQAVLRGRQQGENVQWSLTEISLAIVGLLAIAVGAYAAVRATENIAAALGISQVVAGIFITAVVSAAPEAFSTRSAIQSGQVTAGTTTVIGDKAVTMTIAFVPLGLVTMTIQNFQLFWVSLAFVALMPATFAALIHMGSSDPKHGFKRWQVLILDGLYLAYIGIVIFWVLNIF